MKSLYKEYSLICDICGCDSSTEVTIPFSDCNDVRSSESFNDLKRTAKKAEWLYKDGKHICPRHRRKFQEQLKEYGQDVYEVLYD